MAKKLGNSPLGHTKSSAGPRLDNTGTKEPVSGYTTSKLIVSGNMVETYDFEVPVRYGSKQTEKNERSKSKKSERSSEHRKRTIIRAKNRVRRLIHLNFTRWDKFITLTLDNEQSFDINNLQECLPFYQNLMKKLRRRYKNFKYITVPEFQERGAVHYHMVCNLPFIEKSTWEKLWGHGFVKPKTIVSRNGLATYLTKYLSKQFEQPRIPGHRLYYSSKSLKRSRVIYGAKAEYVSKKLKEKKDDTLEYQSQYKTDRNGTTTYRQYVKE